MEIDNMNQAPPPQLLQSGLKSGLKPLTDTLYSANLSPNPVFFKEKVSYMRHSAVIQFWPIVVSILLPVSAFSQTPQLRIEILQGRGSNDVVAKTALRPRVRVTDAG